MKTLLMFGAAAAALVAGTAIAQAPQAPAPKAEQILTRGEVQAKVTRLFAKLDSNRDELEEFANKFAAAARAG